MPQDSKPPTDYSIGNVQNTSISQKMQQAYLDYAMSVIVSRALPDVRDGLKPVQRRILYAMNKLGLTSRSAYRKSAQVVGEVIGKYHPHGDSAVYDALVRLAQDFSMRYELIDGQGNFGSIDGDNAAAMRYTECRMSAIANELLADINKNTVDFRDNYDGSHQEPSVLPAKIPTLLLEGTQGIAVGMATSIPPHNLKELLEACKHLVDNPEATIENLMEYITGPDFPTGASIYDRQDILNAYTTGRGGVMMRAINHIEDAKGGKKAIIIDELPYQVNKKTLQEKIADLVKNKTITGIAHMQDESDREGMRIYIELKRDAIPKVVLNQLYKHTPLQLNFNFNMVALIDGNQPRLLNLKQILEEFIKHRRIVITRRTQFELKQAKARAHILEGLKIALDNLDDVIATIRAAKTQEEAHTTLIKKFSLSPTQAKAILDMQLRRLAALERQKIEEEYQQLIKLIADLEDILARPERVSTIIKEEFIETQKQYGDSRKTQVIPHGINSFNHEDFIKKEDVYITLTRSGYIKRMTLNTYKIQSRGGKGVIGITTKEEDYVEHMCICSTHSYLLIFTNQGTVFKIKAYEVPETSRTAKGMPIINLLPLEKNEWVQSIQHVEDLSQDKILVMATQQGTIKRTSLDEYSNIRSNGIIAINLRDGDQLASVAISPGNKQIMLITKRGQSIRFEEQEVRLVSRASIGVKGINLKKDDSVISMGLVEEKDENTQKICLISANGYGKNTLIKHFPVQSRAGKGVIALKVSSKTGTLASSAIIDDLDGDLVAISTQGQVIRIPLKSISTLKRSTQGVRIMKLKKNDGIASFTIINSEDED